MALDLMKAAFLFPGQGSQFIGMGRELAQQFPIANDMFMMGDEALGRSLTHVMWTGEGGDLNDTINTQPALYLHSMAVRAVLQSQSSEFLPGYFSGHSLGELSALAAAGVFEISQGLKLVQKRGELMKKAGELSPGGMAAILGLDIPVLEGVCAQASQGDDLVQVANDNCPGQVVISGAKPALERALELAKQAGARRAVPLAVSIAAHSPLMHVIQDPWNAAVDGITMSDPIRPVVGNVVARGLQTSSDLRKDIKDQMTSRVRWTESIRHLSENGITIFVEIGSGNVLCGLVKRILPEAECYPLGKPEDFEKIL